MESSKRTFTKIAAISIWAIFTLSLASWWYIYSMSQLERLSQVDLEFAKQFASSQKMLAWEGAFLLICILGGGVTLAYFVIQDSRRQRRVMDFFLTLSHELKTPLAGIQLQAESLKEDLGDTPHRKVLDRLLKESKRLNAQLENALSLANLKSSKLFLESINLESFLSQLFIEQPEVDLEIGSDINLTADSKALSIVFTNLVRNSLIHGHAEKIFIKTKSTKQKNLLEIEISDNGKGFQGDHRQLGKRAFDRHYRGSGNGLGLYLCRRLIEQMNGSISFASSSSGFEVNINLQKSLA